MTRFPRARRRAFTLIELLVVIAIIAIIVSLGVMGVMSVLRKRPEANDITDIKNLEEAIGKFYAKHNCYPPDTVKLCHYLTDYVNRNVPGSLDYESVLILTKIWPSVFSDASEPVPWSGFDRSKSPWQMIQLPVNASQGGKRCVVLEGDQCLVFFLGGPWGVCGFSDSAKYPIHDPAHPNFASFKRTRFYEFPPSRLKALYHANMPPNADLDPQSGVTRDFPSFIDNWQQQPFVYFVGGNKNTYNVLSSPLGARKLRDGTVVDLGGVNAYYDVNKATGRKVYQNPSTFQIICAGGDGKFGNLGGPWPTLIAAGGLADWHDNHANFHPNRLSVK